MAHPAEIANDMAAHAVYWAKRDAEIARACRDAARIIRAFLNRERVDGRSWGGLHRRLLALDRTPPDCHVKGYPEFTRARLCLERLKREAA